MLSTIRESSEVGRAMKDFERFTARTIEQVRRFKELKEYPQILLSIKRRLAHADIVSNFYNRSCLYTKIKHPSTGKPIVAGIQAYFLSHEQVEIFSPDLPYQILIYCQNGDEFYNKAKKGGLL